MGILKKKKKKKPSLLPSSLPLYFTFRGNTEFKDSKWELSGWNLLSFMARRMAPQNNRERLPVLFSLAPSQGPQKELFPGWLASHWGCTEPLANPFCILSMLWRQPHAEPLQCPARDAPGSVRWLALPQRSVPSQDWSSAWLSSPRSGRMTWGLPAKQEHGTF